VRLRVEDGADRLQVDVELTDWNEPVQVAAPAASEIDPTPWVDEAAIAEVRATITPVGPTVLPDGFHTESVEAVPAEETPEECGQLLFSYSPIDWASADPETVEDADFDYLDVYLLPASCALDFDDTPFAPGPFGALAVRDTGYGWEVLVGDTVVQFDTTLRDEDLAPIVASIGPLDLDALVAEYNQQMEESGGWYAYPG
jgi:hypothetical protein